MVNAGIKFNVEGTEQASQKISQLKSAMSNLGSGGQLNPLGSGRDLDTFLKAQDQAKQAIAEKIKSISDSGLKNIQSLMTELKSYKDTIKSEGLTGGGLSSEQKNRLSQLRDNISSVENKLSIAKTTEGLSEADAKRIEQLKLESKSIDDLNKSVKDLYNSVRKGKADIDQLTKEHGLRTLGVGESLALQREQAQEKYMMSQTNEEARKALSDRQKIDDLENRLRQQYKGGDRGGLARRGYYADQFQRVAGAAGGATGEVIGAGLQITSAATGTARDVVSSTLSGLKNGGIFGGITSGITSLITGGAEAAALTAGLLSQMSIPRGTALQDSMAANRMMFRGGVPKEYGISDAGRYSNLALTLNEMQQRITQIGSVFGGTYSESETMARKARQFEMVGGGNIESLISNLRYESDKTAGRGGDMSKALDKVVGIADKVGSNNAGLKQFLENTTSFQQMQVGRFDNINTAMAGTMGGIMQRIGGMFGGQNMMNIAGRLDAAITNGGGSPYTQARLYQSLSASKPSMTVDELVERTEQGLTPENLKAIMSYEKGAFGSDKTAMIRSLKGYGLTTAEARRLVEYSGDLSGADLMGATGIDVGGRVEVSPLKRLNTTIDDALSVIGNKFINTLTDFEKAIRDFAGSVAEATKTVKTESQIANEIKTVRSDMPVPITNLPKIDPNYYNRPNGRKRINITDLTDLTK